MHVPVSITWDGTTPSAHPDKVVVKLSHGHKRVLWTSDRGFTITVEDQKHNAEERHGKWVCNSRDFDAPRNIHYEISLPNADAGHDPEIEIQT